MYISSGFLLLLLFLGATSFSSLFFWALVCVCVQPVSKRITTGGRTCSLTFLFARFLFLKGHVCVRPAGGNEIVSVCLLFPFRLSLSLSFSITGIFFSWWCNIGPLCPHILSHVRFERGWNFEEEKTTTLAPIVIFVFVCFFIRVGCVCVMFGALRNLENLFFLFYFYFLIFLIGFLFCPACTESALKYPAPVKTRFHPSLNKTKIQSTQTTQQSQRARRLPVVIGIQGYGNVAFQVGIISQIGLFVFAFVF